MAIDPNLVSIIPASELPTGVPTSAGQFFFYEGNEMKKSPMTEIYELVSGSQSIGTITPSSTIPTEGNVWGFAGEGTYNNAGNITVAAGKFAILSRVGTTWSKVEADIPVQELTEINSNQAEFKDNFKQLYNTLDRVSNVSNTHVGTFQDEATPQLFGLYNSGVMTVKNTAMAIGSYTAYLRYKVNIKGNALNLNFFSGTTSVGTDSITVGEWKELIITRTTTEVLNVDEVLFQIRSEYADVNVNKDLNITISNFDVFKGILTLNQIKDFLNLDKSKVEKSKLADRALIAYVAETIEKLPTDMIDEVDIIIDKKDNIFPNTNVDSFDSTMGLQPTEYSINRVDGQLKITANVSNFLGDISNQRVWFGIDFKPEFYATNSKNVLIVIQGRLKSTNVRNFKYEQASGQSTIILQDLNDGVWTNFKAVVEFSYVSGSTSNKRYTYTNFDIRNGATSFNIEMEFDCFGALEKNSQTKYFSVDELIEAINVGSYSIKEKFLPKNLVNGDDLNNKIDSLNLSKYSPNDYSANGVEMLIGYGQSLAVGDGASNSSTDFKNSVAFNGGVNISSYASSEIPDSAISSFVPIANQSSYTPITASLVSMLELLQNENKVDVSKFGNKYLCVTGGVSGASITSMNKGTIPYSNLIKAVTKAKQLANAEGLPFKVSALNWVQGEADATMTQNQYYLLLKQFFIDLNTDIKAITLQTDDIKFITYQIASWLNLWFPSGATTQQSGDVGQFTLTGVQKAQLQVSNELPNVYLCGAMYQFEYSDFFHPSDRAVVGLQQGVALKRILADNEDFKSFKVLSHLVIGNYINLKFDVPVKPMRFDLATDIWHNSSNGVRPFYGFKVMKNGVNIISENPKIINGDTVVIKCSESPLGAEVRYAEDGHYGGGNLCDSQNITINNKGINYKVDNFALSFDNYIIN